MSDMIKRFIFERVSENIITKPWMKACYRDYQTREIVMAAWPLNYAIQLAWMLNLSWQRYRHRESWIDRMVVSEARLKFMRLERERDEAINQIIQLRIRDELNQLKEGVE
jgi:hypothetical protein